MLKLVVVAALVAVTTADSGGGGLYSDVIPKTRQSQQCAGVCKDSARFSLKPGWTYVYSYEGTTTSEVAGSGNETSQIKISAKAHISVSSRPCELILSVQDVQLLDSDREGLRPADGQKEFAAHLEQYPLRFSFQDGRVDQLCPSADEPAWTLNIKRGLLSMFQNSMSDSLKDVHMYEKDVSGNCETTYSVAPSMWNSVKVLKYKDLQSCSGKGHHTLGLPTSWTTGGKSTPIIKSEQICEQTIRTDNGTYLAIARCQESHVFAPFSNGASGVRTVAETALSLDSITQSDATFPVDLFVNKRTGLIFEYSPEDSESAVTTDQVWNVLNQLADHSQLGVDDKVPQLFNQLVRLLSRMDDQQLVKLFDDVRDSRTRSYLLDALPLLGSASSVWAMYQIYVAGEVTRPEVEQWLAALAFHQHPTLELVDRLGLFMSDGYQPKTWLAAGAIVHSYCKHDPNCHQKKEVQVVLGPLELFLSQSCQYDNIEEQQQKIVALKAIGNAGSIVYLDTLETCLTKAQNALEVRLAAVAATRRMDCGRVSRLPLLRLLNDKSEDSELRIAAYLGVLQCPTTSVVSSLRDLLRGEDTNQVLSFIWTHLTNLQESSSSWRRDVRQMLQDTYLANKFKTDARKFSRNYEMSAYSDILNSGVTVDSNVIFSTKSYLPRSANLNLTLDLFGETINIFEIGTRVEGFESIVESVFGPKGLFPDESMQKMLKNMRESNEETSGVIESLSKSFTKGIKNEPQGTMFVRILGNELYLSQFTGLGNIIELKNVKKQGLKYLKESLSSILADKNVDFSKSFRFINTEHVIPTIIGLPLKVKVNGTASVAMKLKTKVDLDKILKTSSGNIVLSANPSAAISIDGEMVVDAVFSQAGVETKGLLSSNTYLDTNVKVENGKVIDLFVNVPRDKLEMINVTSSVYMKKRDQLVEIEGVGEVSEQDSCSEHHVPTLSGLRVCSQYVWRNASAIEDSPYFPLTGKFQYALALQKTDDFEFYQFHLKKNFNVVNQLDSYFLRYHGDFNIEIDTPGSKVNRRLAANLSVDTRNGYAKMELESPAGSVGLSTRFSVGNNQGVAELAAKVNREEYAALKLGMQVENGASNMMLAPSLTLQVVPNDINVSLSGEFNIVHGSKYGGAISAVGLTEQPIEISGEVTGAKGRYSGHLAAMMGKLFVKVNSHVVNTAAVTSCKTQVRYVLPGQSVHSVDFSGKLTSHKRGGFIKKQLVVNLQMSQAPHYNTKVGWILYKTRMYLDSNLDLTVGRTQWKTQQLYHNNLQQQSANKTFAVIVSLECPSKNLDYKAELQYKTTDDTIHAHTLAQLSSTKRFVVRADYSDIRPQRTVELEAASPWSRASLEGELTTEEAQGVNCVCRATWGSVDDPQWITASGRYFFEETPLSATNVVEGKVEAVALKDPIEFTGIWSAKFEDGLITSESELIVFFNKEKYSFDVGYVKNPLKGKHDIKIELNLPDNSYKGNFLLINHQERKNVTVRLDLEKSLYFTTELLAWKEFDLQLFWNYLEDKSQSVLVQYQNTPALEAAIISMPGHYASLTVDKLAPGFSSMNITAMWGESEGSATNAILLSTYWNLKMSSVYAPALGYVAMPVIEANIHLTTPFIGFSQQSFVLNVNSVENPQMILPEYSFIRTLKVETKWQEQFINFNFIHNSTFKQTSLSNAYKTSHELHQSLSSVSCSVDSSLDMLRDVNIKGVLQDQKEFMDNALSHGERSHSLNVSYNNWSLTSNSTYTPAELSMLVGISNKEKEEAKFLGEISVKDGLILIQSSFSPEKKIFFRSTYHWPDNVVVTLETPYTGFELSTIQYKFAMDDEILETKLTGEVGKEFFSFLTNLRRSQSKLYGKLDISSSSTIPDLKIKVDHETYNDYQKSTIRDGFAISLSKGDKVFHSGECLLSFVDHQVSVSSKLKQLETVILLPGHSSSFNYSYQSQVKLTGIEKNHDLNLLWNSEKIQGKLVYEGLNSVTGFVKRNSDKKAEFSFRKLSNTNYKIDFFLEGGYTIKHRLFFTSYKNWENFLAVSSPYGKLILKNLQTLNSEGSSFVHKTTVSLNKEVAYVDFVYNLDSETMKLQNILVSTTTPWYHPVVAKYDLLIDTGATSKHEIELKYKQGQEIRGVFDIVSSEKKHSASFNLYTPYCKDLAGKFSFQNDGIEYKGGFVLNAEEKQITADVQLVKNLQKPLFVLNLHNSNERIVSILSTYDILNLKKEFKVVASYYDAEVSLGGQYTLNGESLKMDLSATTPITGWKSLSIVFDSKLSERYSMFALNYQMDNISVVLSGTGSFVSDFIQSSVSVDYSIYEEHQKHSVLFEYNRGKESLLLSFNCKSNEIGLINFKINLLKEPNTVVNQDSYLFTYKAQTPLETLPDSDVEMRFIKNGKAQRVSGDFNVNNQKITFKGENTFDSSGVGYLDLNIRIPDHRVGLLLKHTSEVGLEDSYIVQLINNGKMYVDGTVTVLNVEKGFNIKYALRSSIETLSDIKGTTVVKPDNNSFDFDSSLSVNGDNSNIAYKVVFSTNNEDETKHDLNVLVNFKGLESRYKGDLEYKHSNSELVKLKGQITDGKSVSDIYYSKTSFAEWSYKINLAEIIKITGEKNGSCLMLSVKKPKTESTPNFDMSMTVTKSVILFEADNTLIGKVYFSADISNMEKPSISTDFNGIKTNTNLHISSGSVNLKVTSNIPLWSEFNVLVTQSKTDDKRKSYHVNVSKENQEIFYLNSEGEFSEFHGNGLFTLTMHKFSIDLELNYEFSLAFSLNLNYNVNGNKQHTGGKLTLSPDSARLDLATPIKGLEDLTLSSTLNRKDKKIGLLMEKNGKTISAEILTTFDGQRVILKGSVTDGKDEFVVSIGAQNGTTDEPKSASFYITAFKNKLAVLMISLDGSYDLQRKAGIKFSFSSYFYKQVYFEISSLNEEDIHSFMINYMYGLDIAYSLKSKIVKRLSNPTLVIESDFGSRNTLISMSYDIVNPTKATSVLFRHGEKLVNVVANVSFTKLKSEMVLTMTNENIISGLRNFNIYGGCKFEDESSIDALFIANDVKYFDLSFKSSSLYKTKFQSSLISNEYFNSSYDISLNYNLALPDLSVSTHVFINKEYYKSNAYLTWNESVANVFYQLSTNAGFGFEDAVMSAHYKHNGSTAAYSHFIDFTIDDSTLFHIASNISCPNRFSLDIVLPDSLFLPFVKEISAELSLTEEENKILFKYLSGSQEKRKLDLDILLKAQQCTVRLGRSEVNEESNLQSDSFNFSYKLLKNVLEFETSLIWENDDLFTVYFTKEAFWDVNEDRTLSQVLFSPGSQHVWKFVFVDKDVFEFSGIINGSKVEIILTHPSTVYHNQLGVTKFAYSGNVDKFERLKVLYSCDSAVRGEVHFNNPTAYVMNLLNNQDSYETFASLELVHQTGVVNVIGEGVCEGAKFIASTIICDAMRYKLYQTNTLNPTVLYVNFNMVTSQLDGMLSKGSEVYTFGGSVDPNRSSLMCSSVSMYYKSLDSLSTPFALRYETNCLNSMSAALNLFEENTMAFDLVFDWNKIKKSFHVEGKNIYYNQWNVSAVLNNNHNTNGNIDIYLEENNVKANFLVNQRNKILLLLETTYKDLKVLEFTHEDKYSDVDFVLKNYVGNFKFKGSRADMEWNYAYKILKNDTLQLTVQSANDLTINLEFDNSKDITLLVNKNGKLYKGSGSIKNSNHKRQGNVVLTLDGIHYELSFEHFTSEGDLRTSVVLNTPFDQYFAKLYLEKKFDLQTSRSLRLMTVKYKTPYYPLDSAEIEVEYSANPVITETVLSIEELKSLENKNEKYELSYSEVFLRLAFKTRDINIDDALVHVTFGNKYSLNLKFARMNIKFEMLLLNNNKTLASQTTVEIMGIDCSYVSQIDGKSFIKIYFDPKTYNLIALLKSPLIKNVLITSEYQRIKNTDSDQPEDFSFNGTAQVVYGQDTILKLDSNLARNKTMSNGYVGSDTYVKVLVNSQWENNNILKSTLDAKLSDNQISSAHLDIDCESAKLQVLYKTIATDSTLVKSLEFHVDKSFAGAFTPEITFKRQVNENSAIEYNLNFTNGFSNEKYLLNGRGSLKIPDLSLFSISSKPSITAEIFLESHFAQYESVFEVLFQRNKLDTSLKWRRSIKPIKLDEDLQFLSLLFGGEIQKNSAEFYLDDNRFFGSIESTESQTSLDVKLTNSKLNKNITVFASVQFTPIFLMTLSHTVFDSPCSIQVKINRKPQTIESAVIVVYNSLKQQAYVNVYLDSSPSSVELIYIDIWQQIHQVSGQIENKDDEMTIKGTINSPALDENFIIINVGNNNDKFDLNLSDMVIIKAFKNDKTLLLNLMIFGNDYSFYHENKSGLHTLAVESPVISGAAKFSFSEILTNSFATGFVHFNSYHFLLDMNKNQLFNMSIENGTETILHTAVEFGNSSGVLQLNLNCNYLHHTNSLTMKHTSNPILLVLSVNSSLYLHNFDIMLGLKNEEVITGVFEVKHEIPLFKSYLVLSKENKSIEMTAEAPFFSEMDKVKINGVFKFVDTGDCEVKLSGAISSAETLMAHISLHFVNSDEVFSTGLIIKNKINNFNGVEITVDVPLQFSRDMKANFVLHLPYLKSYEFTSSLCISENKAVSSAVVNWQDQLYSLGYSHGETSFYTASYEWNIHYKGKKMQIGAWTKPKYPLTDYIYFVDHDDKRVLQLSHALVLQHNHFKSKLVVESAFKGHEKYGIDLELQNLKVGKVVKLLGSAPQIGADLGIDFVFSYESLLNYAVLAQIRVPYDNQVKSARLTSVQKIQRSLNSTKLKHMLECDDVGAVGWEFEMFGAAPFFWQGDLSALETKVTINSAIYSTKVKSYLQSNKIKLSCVLEAPLVKFKKGELHVSGTKQFVGSELVLSLNSNEIVNATISKDLTNNNHIKILSKWRNILLTYLYEVYDEELGLSGFICWDLNNKDTSQLGLAVASKKSEKYETSMELTLPSPVVPKLGAKAVFSNKANELFTLLQFKLPNILVEGKFACDSSPAMWKSGLQLKWTPENSSPKDIGLFYVREINEDEIKTYFTLQHFSLKSDIMLSTYVRNTLYGVHLQYSPVKEEELTLELGYWKIQGGDEHRSGVKFTALHPASNTLIYSVANITSTVDFLEGGVSVAYSGKTNFEKIRYVEIFGKKNKKVPQVFLGFSSNGNTLGIGGSIWTKDNSLRGVTVEARANQNDPFRLELVHNSANPGIEAELSYSLSRTYRAYVGMPNNNEVTGQLSHTIYGRPKTDALATLRLNSSKTLWGKFEFPPMTEVGQELYNGVLDEYAEVTLVSKAISEGFIDFVNEDFSEKVLLLLNSVSSQRNMLVEQTSLEMQVVLGGFENFGKTLQRCYETDHFFLKTGVRNLKQWGAKIQKHTACIVSGVVDTFNYLAAPVVGIASRVWELIEPVLQQWKTFIFDLSMGGDSSLSKVSELVTKYRSLRQAVIEQARLAIADLRHKTSQWEHMSCEWLTQAELTVNRIIESAQQTVSAHVKRVVDYTQTLMTGFSVLRETVKEMVDIVTEGVYRIKEVRQTVEWVTKAVDKVNSWFTNFRMVTYLRHLDTFCDRVIQLIMSDVEKNFGEYEIYLRRAQLFLTGQYEELSKIPEIHYIRRVINHVYQKARWIWNYTKMSERLREAVRTHLENLRATFDNIENRLDQEERDMRFEYEYNNENNTLTFSQELPFKWRAFNELPEYNIEGGNRGFSLPTLEYSNMVQNIAQYAWQDAKLLPYLLPPLGSDAIISNRKVVTFDNSYYEIPWACGQYLLAADLYHNTFSLVLDLDQGKRDMLLTTQDIKILVKNNFEVYVNGQLEDLPLTLSNEKRITVERKPHSVCISSEDGFTLECTGYQEQCRFHVDGWYTGKVAGLMGTYNNEPLDDFVDPARTPTETVERFVSSWQMDDLPCDSVTDVGESEESSPSYESECELFFSSQSSPFYPCFHVVDPKGFYDMCQVNARKGNVCGTVFAYLTKCTSSGVQLWMPEFCVTDSYLSEAAGIDPATVTPSRMTADVVFVVEEADCIKTDKFNFTDLPATLNTELRAKGMTDNHFAFVSFNTKEAQIQTINGHIWTEDNKQLANIISRLDSTSTSTSAAYISALDLATNFPFRVGASKMAVLVHCSSCPVDQSSSGVLERLAQLDMSLHVLQQDVILGKRGHVSKAIGLEKSGAYPRKRLGKNTSPSAALLEQVSVPRDLCTPLVLGTNGTLFTLDVAHKGLKVWGARVAAGAVPPTPTSLCETSLASDNTPVVRCHWAQGHRQLKEWDQTTLDEYMDTSKAAEIYTEYEEVDR